MNIPEHKIKAAAVFILALGIGIGVPLYSRIQNQNLQTSTLTTPNEGTSFAENPTASSSTNSNNSNVSQIPLPPPAIVSNQTNSSATNSSFGFQCIANPSSVKVSDPVIWAVSTFNPANQNSPTYIWTGAVTGEGQSIQESYDSPGTYNATVMFHDSQSGNQSATCSVQVLANQSSANATNTSLSSAAPNSFSPAISPNPPATISSTTTDSTLAPPPEMISCTLVNPTIVLSQTKMSVMKCINKPPTLITAWVIKGDYTPPENPDPTSIIKTFVFQQADYDQSVSFNWNGIDNYDNPVPAGNYTFIVEGQKTADGKPDISFQKIQVVQNVDGQTQEITQQTSTTSSQQVTIDPQTGVATTNIEPTPPPTPTPAPTPSPVPTPTPVPPPAPIPSRCTGVNYPTDIENYWAKPLIKLSYDNCVFAGYSDGTFHPEGKISRAEALKATLLAAGIPPKLGCFDVDCGTPFLDLLPWQSQWVRAAWDQKIVKGVSETLFAPQRFITRGEAIILIAKAFGIPPHQNCFTAGCGAGYPLNNFLDITDPTQGSYIRSMWDLKIIQGTGPNTFTPNRLLTRGEMAAILMNTAQSLGKIKNPSPQNNL